MSKVDPYRSRRLLACLVPVFLIVLAFCLAGAREIAPDEWLIHVLMLTAFAMVSGVALEILFPESTWRKKALQRVLLALSLMIVAVYVASTLWPTPWETGQPGRSMELDFRHGEVSLVIDYSNATAHDIMHGTPGYSRISLPIGLILAFLLPLTLIVWFDVIESKLPWLKSRHPPGHCQSCGYNLTGNVSGICPECGSRISKGVP